MRLEIDRLSLDCLVGGDHPDPNGARDRVAALAQALPAGLAPQLRPFSGGDEIVLIRSLELDLAIDLDGPESAVLAQWSRAFAAQLARQLSARGQGVVRFADRADQLACFVRDLVDGDAWGLWFHRPFDGLRALPTGRALATALGADPIRGQAALGRLDERTIAQIGELLGEDAVPLAETLCEDMPDEETTADLVRPLCKAALRHAAGTGPRLLATLKAHAIATGRPCGPQGLALCRNIVAALAEEGTAADDRPSFSRRHGEPRAATMDATTAEGAAEDAIASRVRAYAATAEIRRIGTPFGGPLLLLRDLDRIDTGIPPLTPGPGGWPVTSALRALVLARLAGPGRERDFLADPFWRNLLDIPPEIGIVRLTEWARAHWSGETERRCPETTRMPSWPSRLDLPEAAAHDIATMAGLVLDGFARRLPGFSRSSAGHLQANFLGVRATILRHGDDQLSALVSRPPLDPILALSGAADWTAEFAWTHPSRISVSREPR